MVMSLLTLIGPEGNLLDMGPEQCQRLELESPLLSNEQLMALKRIDLAQRGWKTKVIDITFPRSDGLFGYEACLQRVKAEAAAAVDEGHSIVVLSDRAVGPDRVPLSTMVASGGVHHHLIQLKQRMRVALIVETGEAREVHQMCCLLGYGVDAICPWSALDVIRKAKREGLVKEDLSVETLQANYFYALNNGILKVIEQILELRPIINRADAYSCPYSNLCPVPLRDDT